MRCLAGELGPKGIKVNSVNPTVVMTAMGRKVRIFAFRKHRYKFQNWSDPAKAHVLLDRMPIKRFAGKKRPLLKKSF